MIEPFSRRAFVAGLLAATAFSGHASAQAVPDQPIISAWPRRQPVFSSDGMVASQDKFATEVGVAILAAGGSAVDAAVAVGFALAVTLPRAGNLGGGGFMVLHDARTGQSNALDFRETAPASATKGMYLNAAGDANLELAQNTGLGVGIPGTVAGLLMALEKHGSGKITRQAVLAPAISLAKDGITIGDDLAFSLRQASRRLGKYPASMRIFGDANGKMLGLGDTLKQAELAASLEAISAQGADGFYKGRIADLMVKAVNAAGGSWTTADLEAYRAIARPVVKGSYRGHEIISMPPPSSGGVHLVQILNMMERFDVKALGHNSADLIHLFAEASKLAYADRSEYLGDPAFVTVPVKGLTSQKYAAELAKQIDMARARPGRDIKPGRPQPFESDQTTHYSVMDKDGNAVSVTYTLNFSYGVGMVAEGTGILMNNELDDFAAKPGVPNAYGLVGGDANAPGPGKRPLSSMTPTIVLKDGKPFLITGSPGGSRIITTVVQIVSNVIDHGMNIAEATEAPRVHHQWLPDEIRIERGLSIDTLRLLEQRGHKVSLQPSMGSTHSIMVTPAGLEGASDLRQADTLSAGPRRKR